MLQKNCLTGVINGRVTLAVIATMLMAFVLVIIPIMLVVLFEVAVLPAIWALVIPRLRDYIYGLSGVIARC